MESPKPKRKYTRSGKYNKKAKPAKKEKKLKPKTFLFFAIGKDEFTETVESDNAMQRAIEIFNEPDYAGLEKIYFMQPLKIFNRPVMEVTEL